MMLTVLLSAAEATQTTSFCSHNILFSYLHQNLSHGTGTHSSHFSLCFIPYRVSSALNTWDRNEGVVVALHCSQHDVSV